MLYFIDIAYKQWKIINMHNKNDRNTEINIHVHVHTYVHKHNTQNITHANNKITPSEIGLHIQQLYIRCGYII